MSPRPRLVEVTEVPTPLGTLRGYAFLDADGTEVIAVVRGRIWGRAEVPLGISANDGTAPPSTALGAFEDVVVVHFRPRPDEPPNGVRRREDERRFAIARAVVRRLGVRSVRLVTATPMGRMEKR